MKKNLEVVLVSPHTRAFTPRPPLGLMYISSYLESKGIKNSIIDVKSIEPLQIVLKKIVDLVVKKKPDIVGLTCLATEIREVRQLAKLIKERLKDVIIIIGGAQPTFKPEHFLDKSKIVDYVVVGEGEITFFNLIDNLIKEKKIKEVPGIAYFSKNKLIETKSMQKIENLDELPFPDYDRVDMEYYAKPTAWGIRGVPLSLFFIFTSRGCPYRCKFCVTNIIWGKIIRQRSAKNVVDEIEYLVKKYKIDGVFFYDDSFTFNEKRAIQICDEIIKRNLKVLWGCQTRVNLVSDKLVKKMKQSGCIQIDFGIESGSQRILDLINKDITVEQINNAIRICRKHKLRIFANFMVNLPGETEEDLNKTIKMANDIDATLTVWNPTTPWPGSGLSSDFTLEEYYNLIDLNEDDRMELLESKYKFAKYKHNIKKLVHELYKQFPNPDYINYKPNFKYLIRSIKTLSFLTDPRYIKQILRSKRKMQYLIWFYGLVFNRPNIKR